MAITGSIGMFGDKVVIGALDVSFLDASSRLFPGTLVPMVQCIFNLNGSVGLPRTHSNDWTTNRSWCSNSSLEVVGITNIFGVQNVLQLVPLLV